MTTNAGLEAMDRLSPHPYIDGMLRLKQSKMNLE